MLRLSSSQEDYLEAILGLIHQTGNARAGDIADRLRVARPSVTVALRALARRRLVIYEPYRRIRLTAAGRTRAEHVLRRHETIRCFFTEVLGVPARLADANACRIEHAISDEVMQRLTAFMNFLSAQSLPARRLPAAFQAAYGRCARAAASKTRRPRRKGDHATRAR